MAACLAKENPAIKTFTVGFAEYEGRARRDQPGRASWPTSWASRTSSKHIGEEEYWASLPRLCSGTWTSRRPTRAPWRCTSWTRSAAAQGEGGAVRGEGADEFFGGYRIYQTPFANQKLAWAPKGLLRRRVEGGPDALGVRGANYLERARGDAGGLVLHQRQRRGVQRPRSASGCARASAGRPRDARAVAAGARRAGVRRGGGPRRHHAHAVRRPVLLAGGRHPAQDGQDVDGPFAGEPRAVPGQAACSRCRPPCPPASRPNDEQTKLALREAAERAIPKDWAQKEKLGFPVPVVSWLRQDRYYDRGEGREFDRQTARAGSSTPASWCACSTSIAAGADRSRKIWIVYMFLMWYRIYFEDRKKPAPPTA